MIHRRHSAGADSGKQEGSTRARSRVAALSLVLALSALVGSCDDNGGVGPGVLRFGWVGDVTVELTVPLRLGAGELTQVITWSSNGFWTRREQISYRGLVGDETRESVAAFGDAYARFITQVNETPGLVLIDLDELPSGITAECGPTQTKITVAIYDDTRGQTRRWTQCADGSLSSLVPQGAGPEPAAARLVQAIIEARNATVGPDFLSAYHGSIPFGTLSRGEDTGAKPTAPFVITDPASWGAFWLDHAGSSDPPSVDFGTEMVVVAAVGERGEAGDSVEVRRILQVGDGTLTHIFERVPGDFCSPIARKHYPFHIVVSPATPPPVRFAEIGLELVSCGG